MIDGAGDAGAGHRRDPRPEIGEVAAEIGERAGLHAENAPLAVEGHFRHGQVVAAVRIGEHGLLPVRPPLDRPAEPPGGPEHHHRFRKQLAAQAEAAADIGRDDAHPVLRHLEGDIGKAVAHPDGALGRRMQEIALFLRLPLPDGDARLHRVADDAVVREFHADRLRGLRERRLDLGAVMAQPVDAEIGADRFMEDRGARRIGLGGRADRRQHFIFDFDKLGGVARLFRRLRDDEGDRVADITHPVGLEHGAAGIGHARAARPRHIHLAGQHRQAVGRRILPGEHGHDAGRRLGRARVEAQDAGMGVRAAKHDRVGLALDVDIVREAPGAGHEARVFLAPHRLADAELVHFLAFPERRQTPRLFEMLLHHFGDGL